MEFMSRGKTNAHTPADASTPTGGRGRGRFMRKLMRVELFTLIVGSALLLAAVSLYLGFSGGLANESKKINTKEYQAVFLNNGQVYFGRIQSLNGKYVDLTNVFYIQNPNATTTTTEQSNNQLQLIKLGNELHGPEDEMIVNRDQVIFWENLKDSSQVVTKIKEYYQNPNAANGQSNTNTQTNQSTTSPQNSNQTNTNR